MSTVFLLALLLEAQPASSSHLGRLPLQETRVFRVDALDARPSPCASMQEWDDVRGFFDLRGPSDTFYLSHWNDARCDMTRSCVLWDLSWDVLASRDYFPVLSLDARMDVLHGAHCAGARALCEDHENTVSLSFAGTILTVYLAAGHALQLPLSGEVSTGYVQRIDDICTLEGDSRVGFHLAVDLAEVPLHGRRVIGLGIRDIEVAFGVGPSGMDLSGWENVEVSVRLSTDAPGGGAGPQPEDTFRECTSMSLLSHLLLRASPCIGDDVDENGRIDIGDVLLLVRRENGFLKDMPPLR